MRKKKMEHRLIKKRKKWPWILLTLVLLIVLSVGAFWWKYGYDIRNTIADGYSYSQGLKKSDFRPKNSTVIYDRNGKEIKKLSQSSSNYTDINDINPKISQGLVAVEDQRFYIHHGVDLYGIMRSTVSTLVHRRTEGGSTLTQQLVKNVILQDQSQNLTRKLKEMVIAQQLEKKFTKKQILEFYINDVYMGHGSYGFSAASNYYFSQDQKDLSIDKLAVLVGIPNNPVYYDPVIYPKRAIKRRNMILYIFHQRGLISKKTYQTARTKPLGLKINEKKYDNDVSNNYALSYAVFNATEELMKSSGFTMRYDFKNRDDQKEYGIKYNQAYERARGQLMDGGYTIRTTIDQDLQNKIESLVNDTYKAYTGRDAHGKLAPQVSSTVIDNKTGDVIAVVGGRTTEGDQVNRAIKGYRQPGSTAKPLVAYAPAFERGYLPQSTVVDSAVGTPVIHNWYSGYTGSNTLRHALENSINTIAYKLAAQDTKHTYYSDLVKMEFANLDPLQKDNPRLAIGSFTYGVTTTEMASAYSSFSRGGQFIHPSNLSSIYDNDNDRYIYQNTHMKKDVYTKNASYMMINTMQSVISDGLGKAAALDNYKYTAGKTGTTDDTKDSYFVGMTPSFTIANWTGNDTPSTLTQSEDALTMQAFKAEGQYLVDYMKQKDKDFKKPSTVTVSGSNLTVNTSNEKPSIQDIIDTNFSKYNTDQENKNTNRLYNLDYRIIYHLTKKEEFSREDKVQKAIDKYNKTPITKESQYNKKLSALQKIRYLNANVKRQSAKNRFNRQILELQKELNMSQAMFQSAKDNKKIAKYESEKEAIETQRAKKRQAMVDKLMPQYNSQLQKVKDAYKNNDSDKEDQKQKLVDIMNEIRSYGGNVPDVKISTGSSSKSSSNSSNTTSSSSNTGSSSSSSGSSSSSSSSSTSDSSNSSNTDSSSNSSSNSNSDDNTSSNSNSSNSSNSSNNSTNSD